ncbi:hypothetical protein EDB81DRAFT_676106 [Dactylonectria macrodidyma]|uniref:SRR1-like domain-containing protein n=1 Tax=Dactylonectria macrodidyma TaxID=307937 RepID=A0A9P9FWY3_9HYPO|nr:hypothetical protein EDB81DRAFT_676106 [Dactylonectria macrodidyma]
MSLTITTRPAASWDISNRDPALAPREPRLKHNSTNATPNGRNAKGKTSSKQVRQLSSLYEEAKHLFYQSALSESFEAMLRAKNRPRVNKAVSLGLGTLAPSKFQSRRMKQLVIFIAIASYLGLTSDDSGAGALYAQDPTFTKTDEEFLASLGIQILKTPSIYDLGEAGRTIDGNTVVYSPILTIAAYTRLFTPLSEQSVESSGIDALPLLIGDDFNALRMKWERRTTEYKIVEEVMKTMKARAFQRRAVGGEGFWEEADNTFPMAVYWGQTGRGRATERGAQKEGVAVKARRGKL